MQTLEIESLAITQVTWFSHTLATHPKKGKKNTSKQSKFALRDLLRNQFFDTLMHWMPFI